MRFIKPFILLSFFFCLYLQMEINMMEIEKTVSKKERELKFKFYNNLDEIY